MWMEEAACCNGTVACPNADSMGSGDLLSRIDKSALFLGGFNKSSGRLEIHVYSDAIFCDVELRTPTEKSVFTSTFILCVQEECLSSDEREETVDMSNITDLTRNCTECLYAYTPIPWEICVMSNRARTLIGRLNMIPSLKRKCLISMQDNMHPNH
ncbi:hypothetical protein AVEN_221411-1 [Araneus ventricosus]|uniref:Uncharacterized protein n=1 Tax=Araneus ventricosus TaxID=182803 RepID=A0A4Y2VU88_ARAVE|nr:hypothetical protein AVEN_221411-1 [Araneus ventricosus]